MTCLPSSVKLSNLNFTYFVYTLSISCLFFKMLSCHFSVYGFTIISSFHIRLSIALLFYTHDQPMVILLLSLYRLSFFVVFMRLVCFLSVFYASWPLLRLANFFFY